MSGIAQAMEHIADVERGITIAEPVAAQIRRVYLGPPPQSQTLQDLPCVVNSWSFFSSTEEAWGFRLDRYAVQVQLFIDDASQASAFAIATAFQKPLADALFREPGLDGTVFEVGLRGAGPTVGFLEWAGKGYIGLTLFFDMALVEDATP